MIMSNWTRLIQFAINTFTKVQIPLKRHCKYMDFDFQGRNEIKAVKEDS